MSTGRRFYAPKWEPQQPSPECEVGYPQPCGKPTAFCYPAMGGGYAALCDEHAQKHLPICVTYAEAQAGKVPA